MGASATPAPEPDELLVLEWGGYEAPDFWTDFQAADPDTQVSFEFGDTDAAILALMQGGSQADVFHFYTGWQQFYVDAVGGWWSSRAACRWSVTGCWWVPWA